MRSIVSLLITTFLATERTAASLPTQPNDSEWGLLSAEYLRLDSLRKAQPLPPANASRKQLLELVLDNQKKLETVYVPFLDRANEHFDRTYVPLAGQLLAPAKISPGDESMQHLMRYDTEL